MAVTMLEGWGWPKERLEEGWIGVGAGRMCPEWLKGGRWPTGAMCPAKAAALNGVDFSCMHFDSSSKHSLPFLLFLDLLDIFLFRVWIPSFFMVSGLFTWDAGSHQASVPQYVVKGVPFPSQILCTLAWSSSRKSFQALPALPAKLGWAFLREGQLFIV